ncbi:hypothetical protein CLV92_10960 [Kineococcus xinjiangensis]|uniref:Uncharacterized protein n=1 Tax=Kineococcus xinjiangensis TaxID=512762 RepID=A0A2S6IHT9_9ACTN|nr:hypothetical protein [Kineococcus xinjiangensis]PPK93784.1 hypothetical protein CLV92_10960 [Kineococcus xinjiangensis]
MPERPPTPRGHHPGNEDVATLLRAALHEDAHACRVDEQGLTAGTRSRLRRQQRHRRAGLAAAVVALAVAVPLSVQALSDPTVRTTPAGTPTGTPATPAPAATTPTTTPPATTTPGSATASAPPTPAAPTPVPPTPAPLPAPWSAAPLAASEVPALALEAWAEAPAESQATCPLLLPAGTAGAPPGEPRRPDFSGEWAVTWDVPGTPGRFGDSSESPTAGRSTYGVAGVPFTEAEVAESLPQWPFQQEWSDGSRAGYGPEGGDPETTSTLAYLQVSEHPGCLYNVWSHLGQEHLEALLESLRYVRTDPA